MVSKAITSYVKRPNNHSAFQNSCIMFIGHFFLLCTPSIGKCDFVVAVVFYQCGQFAFLRKLLSISTTPV